MHRFIALILAFTAWCAAFSQDSGAPGLTAAKCFAAIPDSMLEMLTANTRLDMLDYFHAGSDRASQNELGGNARILSEEPYSLTFKYAESDTVQMFVLNPVSKAPLIGMIHTFATPIPDSNVAIYTSSWDKAAVQVPQLLLADWMVKGASSSDRAAVEEALPYILATAAFDPDTSTLTFTHTMDAYFYGDEGKKPLSLLRPSVALKWNGSKFAIAK